VTVIHRKLWTAALTLALCQSAIAAGDPEIPLGIIGDWRFYNDAGWRCLYKGDLELAEQRFSLAIKALRPYYPTSARLLARSYCDLARVLYHEGRYAEAEPLAKWALGVREADKNTTPEVLFQCNYTLGLIEAAEGHYTDAEPVLKKAIALQEKALGEDHINSAVTLEHLAALYTDMQRYTQAESLYKRVIAIEERMRPAENHELADTVSHYAELLRRMRQPAEAEKWESRAKAIEKTISEKGRKSRLDQASNTFQGFK
jgi:tetratricopeptide (TPR) repeat protein